MSVAAARQKRTVDCFQDHDATKGDDRNDPLRTWLLKSPSCRRCGRSTSTSAISAKHFVLGEVQSGESRKPNGYIVLTDFRYSLGREGYRALSPNQIARLFGVGTRTSVVSRTHGALIVALAPVLPGMHIVPAAGGTDEGGLRKTQL